MVRGFLFCLFIGFLFSACTKDSLLTSPEAGLAVSTDSLHFDTLFTQTGSITLSFRIYNLNDQRIRISKVALAGGGNSKFRINVNGDQGPIVENIDINARDSAHVFVNTRIDGTGSTLPYVVQDSILIEWNGNNRWVQLDAWGQNAHFHRNGIISSSQTWTNDLPHVLLGQFTVASGATLRLEKGTKVYCHADAPFRVDGTLIANGGPDDEERVVFSGDRLDAPYRDFPAAWPGIHFRSGSKNNSMTYTSVQQAYQGIISEIPDGPAPGLTLKQCIINNAWDAGLLAIGSHIDATNCLISNCGKNVQLVYGGTYNFDQCTMASYSNLYFIHEHPVVWVTNVLTIDGIDYLAPLDAVFTNCIVWGDGTLVPDEFLAEQKAGPPYNVIYQNSLWKMTTVPSHITVSAVLTNEDPWFVNVGGEIKSADFHLQDGSPAIDKGKVNGITVDLDGLKRPVNAPDMGAYEKQ
ncbi:choice-of-anchor Q domain-containing protein [Flavihumibacter petaseus]|uniref:Right handed beta helix domain-containing protein n=1 Tax=Flavihumibacter petaseus NBRC 106054 TaxID=1220578 RepID=A0A0E9MWM8_9BACT|nr:choice-of-anchor Q domain-containing protein [Flavihumibacter petaseus]GAO41846.1 hypothetical protein FPE01S_01_08610 [Flavihumibacter petaseus NBRC 106054]